MFLLFCCYPFISTDLLYVPLEKTQKKQDSPSDEDKGKDDEDEDDEDYKNQDSNNVPKVKTE